MASLITLPTEIRLQIWRYILPDEVEVSLEEYIARLRFQYSSDGKPIILHRIAYADTTAAHLRVLCRQIYAEVLSISPPVLCPRIYKTELHRTIAGCSGLVKQSLRRVTILAIAASNPTACLKRYFEEVSLLAMDTQRVSTIGPAWMTFAVGMPYSDTGPGAWRLWSNGPHCCDTRYRPAVVWEDDPEFWYETESDGDFEDSTAADG